MNASHYIISIFVAIAVLVSCVDSYDVDIPRGYERRLAIDGSLKSTVEFVSASVAITRLFDYTAQGTKPPVLSEVLLKSSGGNSFELTKLPQDRYGLTVPVHEIDLADEWFLEVERHDGTLYRSGLESVTETPNISALWVDTVEYTVDDYRQGIITAPELSFRIDVPLANVSSQHLLWKYRFQAYLAEELTLDLQGIVPLSLEELQTDKISAFEVFRKRLQDFCRGYTFEVEQIAVSREAFNYWAEVVATIDRKGLQFEPSPGIVLGNMQNISNPEEEVYGYFFAAESVKKVLSVVPKKE